MAKVKVVGTLISPTELKTHGHPIRISPLSKKVVGARVEAEGYLCYTPKEGAFLQVTTYIPTDKPDANACVLEGMILGVMDARKHQKHGQTACILMRLSPHRTSRVLLTVIGSRIKELDVSNLSTGQRLCVRGYICYHKRGLHVLYSGKEGETDE